ncbi:MAG: large subunit ribosomal protein L20 [Verrucomicrobiales bacterium]|jgi:large subunit ribosomal protein L20
MPRSTNAPASRKRRKRMLKKASGYRGFRSTHYRYAKDAVRKAMLYAYRDRKNRKRVFRSLWIQRINAACRAEDITYSRFMEGLKALDVELDRKILADLAVNEPEAFKEIAAQAKVGLEEKRKQQAAEAS